jgi:Ca2+-transporting ATPase
MVFFVKCRNEGNKPDIEGRRVKMSEWHKVEPAQAAQELGVNPEQGLAKHEAESRFTRYGPNELIDRGGKSPWKILWEQLSGIMTVILIVSAIISLFLSDFEDAIAILAIVVLNTILGFTQEYRAEKAMAALKKISVPHVKVRRDGHIQEISARELVPGDILLIEAGNLVPADGRLIEAINLRVQEAVLTGESEPVEKFSRVLTGEHLAVADQRNRVFMGTVVTYGRGTALITGTGMSTELGRIAEMIQTVGSEATPLQRRLEQLARGLAVAALAVVVVVFGLGMLRGEDIRLMFLTAISMAVAAVPEGLPTVVTIGLALGAQRMLGRKALIRKLPAVETLGSVTVICSDKTGTLTENRMTVTLLDVANYEVNLQESLRGFSPTVSSDNLDPSLVSHPSIALLLTGGALCNDAVLEPVKDNPREFTSVGDPTEGALVIAAARADLWKEKLDSSFSRTAELPFDSERKRMTTIHRRPIVEPGGLAELTNSHPNSEHLPYIAFTKGAVDELLGVSNRVWVDAAIQPMDDQWLQRIREANNRLAQNGMRVLGVAVRLLEDDTTTDPDKPVEQDLILVGMIGMIDPARPEVRDSVHTAREAGVRPIMITGDHPLTALYIARELGITEDRTVLTGRDLSTMRDAELIKALSDVSVFARVSPEHKLKIVNALQAKGQIVAMTGDGVNDAPALKKADIGVAMGITGTDVSKESADMVLLDDNFATIVSAVEEGRRIYDNIRKFIQYTLGSNTGEILVMLVAPFIGMPLPLLPLQILWINLVTDGLPGLALTVERAERNTMHRPPYKPRENIFSRGLGKNILLAGVLLTIATMIIAFWGYQTDNPAWQTMAFTTLTLGQMGNVMALRSQRESLFTIGVFSNKPLLGSVLLTFLLQLAVVYLPFFQHFFETVPLTLNELALCLVASVFVFTGVELEKWRVRRSEKSTFNR